MSAISTQTKLQANTALVQQFMAEVWNKANLAAMATFLTDDYVDHSYQPPNREGLAQTIAVLCASFPDHITTIEAHVAQDDLVIARMRLRATHRGDFRGTAATGNAVDVLAYRTFRIADGKIAEHWGLLDTTTLLRQIGTTPS